MTARTAKDKTPAKDARQPADGARPMGVQMEKGETEAATMSRVMLAPFLRHGIVANGIVDKMAGKLPGEPRYDDYAHAIKARTEKTGNGDLTIASEILTAQALSLDAIFTEMARRSALNMGDYLDASERYMRLALKAQANSRATLEALAKLHQPREQTVRHVHVNEGGQAVIADQFHNHTGDSENGKTAGQPHATRTTGTSAALPCPYPIGDAVPIASGEGKSAMPNARRQRQRRA